MPSAYVWIYNFLFVLQIHKLHFQVLILLFDFEQLKSFGFLPFLQQFIILNQ